MRSLPDALEDAAARATGSAFFHHEDGVVTVSTSELVVRAKRRASHLVAVGLIPGDTVGLLGRTSVAWVEWAVAVWFAGGTLVPLQFPIRIRAPAAFREAIASRAGAARCRLVVCEPEFAEFVPAELLVSWHETGGSPADVPRIDPERPAVIQFTSGSTGSPKGVVISHRAVLANIDGMNAAYKPVPGDDAVLSWVPLFHDLGVFKHLTWPLVAGFDCHHLPTELFATDPARWLRLFGETGCTMTTAPASAWAAAVRAARRHRTRVDLTSVRSAIVSAETIDADVVDDLITFGALAGLDPRAIGGAYGLAEFTLGATTTMPLGGLNIERLDPVELAGGKAVVTDAEPSKRVASCGSVYQGTEIRIVSDEGGDLPDRRVGEVRLRGNSMMSGYLDGGTEEAVVDGYLRTGDLGYLSRGELYVTGRIKDVVILLGQNYYPEDFEWAASRVAGVRAGRCAAFSPAADADRIVIVVEPSEDADPGDVAVAVSNAIRDAVAILPVGVVVAAPGTVLKTTSGKLRRGAMRDAYERGEIAALATAGSSVQGARAGRRITTGGTED